MGLKERIERWKIGLGIWYTIGRTLVRGWTHSSKPLFASHDQWEVFSERLTSELNARGVEPPLVLSCVLHSKDLADGRGVERKTENGMTVLSVGSPSDYDILWNRWDSYWPKVEKAKRLFTIHADVQGSDKKGFVYANLWFEDKHSDSGSGVELTFAEGWKEPLPLHQRGLGPIDIQAWGRKPGGNLFTDKELQTIAYGCGIVPGYTTGHNVWLMRFVIDPIIRELEQQENLRTVIFQNSDSNYLSCFVCEKKDCPPERNPAGGPIASVRGVTIQFSLCCPVAAVGATESTIGRNALSWGHLEIEDLLDSRDEAPPLAAKVIQAIEKSPYLLLSREDAIQPLPEGFEFEETYWLSKEPYDKVFHALFADAMVD